MYEFVDHLNRTGEWLYPELKTHWYAGPFVPDKARLDQALIAILKGEEPDPTYTEFTRAQLDDIISCAGTLFVRGDFSMKFKYTDLDKFQNYIGFESGVWCVYPNYQSIGVAVKGQEAEEKYQCNSNEWFRNTYLGGDPDLMAPQHYDPRCRGWYQDQYRKKHTIFTDIY